MSVLIVSSVDSNDDLFITENPHRLTSGEAVKLEAGVAPSGLINGTLYYTRVVSPTVFSLHPTRSDARTGINQIAISSSGSEITFLRGDSRKLINKYTLLVNHLGTEPVATVFSDYSKELIFVEEVNTDYSQIFFTHGKITDRVFMQGITTSPTYIFTQDAPKAAPGPEQIKEYWFLT